MKNTIEYLSECLDGEFELQSCEEGILYRGILHQGDSLQVLTAQYSVKDLVLAASSAALEELYIENLSDFLNGTVGGRRFEPFHALSEPQQFAVLDFQTKTFWVSPVQYKAWEAAVVAQHSTAHPALVANLHKKLKALAGERGYTLVETFYLRQKKLRWSVRVSSPLFDFDSDFADTSQEAYEQALAIVDARLQRAIEDIRAALGDWGKL